MQATIKIHNIAPEHIEELDAVSLLAISGGTQSAWATAVYNAGVAVGNAIYTLVHGTGYDLASD